jgi:H+/gluconate symporter-like permease
MLTLSEQGGVEAQRVDQVLGLPHTWRFPALLCALSIGLLALIAGTAVVASGVARGSMSLTLPLLSSQPCILVLAAVAVLVTAVLRPR